LDNRRDNLRVCTQEQNAGNTVPRRVGKSGFFGVRAVGGKFQCYVSEGNRQLTIGWFDDAITAAKARDAYLIKTRGEFAVLNFPNGQHRTKVDEIIQP
jgi:hypothetical protein